MARELALHALSPAPEVTEALGERLGRALVPGALLALVGELGSGKTTLVRGLARGLGVEEAVASPTFTRMRALPGRLALYHFDAWRGGAESLFEEGGEFLSGEGVGVVEWADRVAAALPRPRLQLELRHRGEGLRELLGRLVPAEPGTAGRALALERALAAALEGAAATPGLEHLPDA
ncbi:MAG TPA: tRNA (adenosine(37)-N6)-threonylcarbamoyltransferase complex ATPase subunit type 1 TsaE [Planctomycetota bacterium]